MRARPSKTEVTQSPPRNALVGIVGIGVLPGNGREWLLSRAHFLVPEERQPRGYGELHAEVERVGKLLQQHFTIVSAHVDRRISLIAARQVELIALHR
jgi:hypothetical protein